MPRIEQLHQNTLDWHRWRLQGIGASDAPVVMGDGAFKTPRTLWSIKTGQMREDAAGPAARRGRELEGLARQVYEQKAGLKWESILVAPGDEKFAADGGHAVGQEGGEARRGGELGGAESGGTAADDENVAGGHENF